MISSWNSYIMGWLTTNPGRVATSSCCSKVFATSKVNILSSVSASLSSAISSDSVSEFQTKDRDSSSVKRQRIWCVILVRYLWKYYKQGMYRTTHDQYRINVTRLRRTEEIASSLHVSFSGQKIMYNSRLLPCEGSTMYKPGLRISWYMSSSSADSNSTALKDSVRFILLKQKNLTVDRW